MPRTLIITAVQAEADAVRAGVGDLDDVVIIAGGIGRVNAAAATTEAIIRHGPFHRVISAGIAGALPESELDLGDIVVASWCIYVEEGLITDAGFQDMFRMGFSLGDFEGNAVPVDPGLLDQLSGIGCVGPIATVATCSGTDESAREVVHRTGAVAEAMEGAAVVHAARRLGVPGIEIRAISNTTGERAKQLWDIQGALRSLEQAFAEAMGAG